MVSEEIVTSLKNAVSYGDDLNNAKQVMINSGYNPADVEEASRFVGGGIMQDHQAKPSEQLTMPTQKKSAMSKLKFWGKKNSGPLKPTLPTQLGAPNNLQQQAGQLGAQPQAALPTPAQPLTAQPQQTPLQQTAQQPAVQTQQLNQEVPQELTPPGLQAPPGLGEEAPKKIEPVRPIKTGHMKEIMLLVLLLFLVGILIVTIVLKDTILGWFS